MKDIFVKAIQENDEAAIHAFIDWYLEQNDNEIRYHEHCKNKQYIVVYQTTPLYHTTSNRYFIPIPHDIPFEDIKRILLWEPPEKIVEFYRHIIGVVLHGIGFEYSPLYNFVEWSSLEEDHCELWKLITPPVASLLIDQMQERLSNKIISHNIAQYMIEKLERIIIDG